MAAPSEWSGSHGRLSNLNGETMQPTGISVDLDQLREQTLFQDLEQRYLESIAHGGWVVERRRACRILGRGDHLEGLYTVFDGSLKLYMLSCSGDERVLRILGPGDTFGEAIMFNAIPSPVFVETLSAVKLGYFPRQIIDKALRNNPQFTHAMLRSMSMIMTQLITDLETCCLQSALQRTVNYLLRTAEAAPPPHVEVQLPAAKAVVASTLNISAETFSRELHRLKDLGLITIDRRTIYLRDRDGLIAAAAGLSTATATA
jgi:CRP-like cAMP-binding protein